MRVSVPTPSVPESLDPTFVAAATALLKRLPEMVFIRALQYLALIVGVTIVVATSAASYDRLPLTRGIKPFDKPVELRFRPVETFMYSLDEYLSATGKPERFLWGFAMGGTIKAKGNALIWNYKVYICLPPSSQDPDLQTSNLPPGSG